MLATLLSVALTTTAMAQEGQREVVEVSLGGSSVLSLNGARGKVTLTDPSIADVQSAGASSPRHRRQAWASALFIVETARVSIVMGADVSGDR